MKIVYIFLLLSTYASSSFAGVKCESPNNDAPNIRKNTIYPVENGKFALKDELIAKRDGSYLWSFVKSIAKIEIDSDHILIRTEIWTDEDPTYMEINATRGNEENYSGTNQAFSFYAEYEGSEPSWHADGFSNLNCEIN